MTRIDREQFISNFKSDGKDVAIDIKDAGTLAKLQDAGVKKEDLAKVDVNKDGKISGNAEYTALYDMMEDRFEKGSPKEFLETTDSRNVPTASGKVYEALKSEIDFKLSQSRAQGILSGTPAIPNNDNHLKHIEQVRTKLRNEGLVTSARGVSVIVISGENDPEHAKAVTRAVGGKASLAKDADVRLIEDGKHQPAYVQAHRYTAEVEAKEKRGATPNVNDLAKLGVAHYEAEVHAATEQIRTARTQIPPDGKTRIGNVSWGLSPIGVARRMIGNIPAGHPIMNRAELEWASQKGVQFDRTNPEHVKGSRFYLAQQIDREMKTLQGETTNKDNLKKLQDNLQKEVDEARKKGLVIFNAAGNDRMVSRDVLGNPKGSINSFDSIKGLITVGAVDLKNINDPKDDVMTQDSAKGKIEIAAPGVDFPVGPGNAKKSGTSYAAPYAASVAALMVAANPKITPDAIEEILTSGRVSEQFKGDRDGAGLLDPVKAVKEAKNWKPPKVTK